MGQIGSGLGDISSNSWGDLTGGEQAGKLGLGALKGGLSGLSQQQQRPQGGGGQIQLPASPPPQVQLPTQGVQGPSRGAPMQPGVSPMPNFFNAFYGN